ncbi:MAG: Holliday junction branch migration protein RuvA [Firmicutes bacterium]|nr:Holliday junction branch migration protein RuvA [Bacillota bacterium]
MIDYLQGRLVDFSPGKVVLDIGGIGIQVTVPPTIGPPAGEPGERATYYTRLLFREDELIIYGFQQPVERDFFNLVTSVSGFGPKLALSMLGVLSLPQIYEAILKEDADLLCQIPGVGKKISRRLIFELKDKLPKLIPAEAIGLPVAGTEKGLLEKELIEALLTLGYSRFEASTAISQVLQEDEEVGQISKEEVLRLALQNLGGSSG